jgi:hypothetical protein
LTLLGGAPPRARGYFLEAGGEDFEVAKDGGRLLVVTGAAVVDVADLPPDVRELLDAASEVLVITPVLPGRLQWLTSDTDRARHEADERLDSVLGHMAELDVPATGQVGDETPLTAFTDALRNFEADHILIALRGPEHAGWQERGLLDRIRAFGIPLTVFEIQGGGAGSGSA